MDVGQYTHAGSKFVAGHRNHRRGDGRDIEIWCLDWKVALLKRTD
jgi:hypothetical protein